MRTTSGYRYAELVFDKGASVVDRGGYDELLDAVGAHEIDDVLVLAPGWNNDLADARLLLRRLAVEFRGVAASTAGARLGLPGRRLALLGLLWPSATFAERDLVPGGAAAVGSSVPDQALRTHLTDLHDVFDAPDANATLDAAEALVPALGASAEVRARFAGLLRGLLPPPSAGDDDDRPDELRSLPDEEILRRLSAPVPLAGPTGGGAGPARPAGAGGPSPGQAAALGLPCGGVNAAAQRTLNLLTYYQMKARADVVGAAAADVLHRLRERRDGVGVHLVGHSFGGRLATAAAAGVRGRPLRPDSLTLVQAAYSHYGFARAYDGHRDGVFRSVVVDRLVRGPVLVTHSDRDVAVGLVYPLVARLVRPDCRATGDAGDRYGGVGRNGARRTPEAVDGSLLPSGGEYRFAEGTVHNLRSDDAIAGHGDIVRPEVAHAILSAVVTRAGLLA